MVVTSSVAALLVSLWPQSNHALETNLRFAGSSFVRVNCNISFHSAGRRVRSSDFYDFFPYFDFTFRFYKVFRLFQRVETFQVG